jgi:hypothetical protein
MRAIPAKAEPYCLMILKSGASRSTPEAARIHLGTRPPQSPASGRREVSTVCLAIDRGDVCGIGVFDIDTDEARGIMDVDSGVKASVFLYEFHPCCGIPGYALT